MRARSAPRAGETAPEAAPSGAAPERGGLRERPERRAAGGAERALVSADGIGTSGLSPEDDKVIYGAVQTCVNLADSEK